MGYKDYRDLREALWESRREVELFVSHLLLSVINSEIGKLLPELLPLPVGKLSDMCVAFARRELGVHPRSLATFTAWLFAIGDPSPVEVGKLANELMKLPLEDSWGAVMALITCPQANDDVLSGILSWLSACEPGAYLSKLISRVPNSSASTRRKAIESYIARENIRVM